MNLFREARLLNYPGQVRSFHSPVAHRTGNAEACHFRTGSGFVEKVADNFAEFAMFAAGKNSFRDEPQVPILGLKISQPGIGPTNIAGQNHFSKFLQRRPSRSRSSSASFGPHVPEA